MSTELLIALCTSIGTGVTVLSIAFYSGKTRGEIGTRLDEHDRRLGAIESWLKQLGVESIAQTKALNARGNR